MELLCFTGREVKIKLEFDLILLFEENQCRRIKKKKKRSTNITVKCECWQTKGYWLLQLGCSAKRLKKTIKYFTGIYWGIALHKQWNLLNEIVIKLAIRRWNQVCPYNWCKDHNVMLTLLFCNWMLSVQFFVFVLLVSQKGIFGEIITSSEQPWCAATWLPQDPLN